MATATLEQQQHLINVLAEKPKQFNFNITASRAQTVALTHTLTAQELKQWAEGFCEDYNEFVDDWENWHQQYLDYLQHGDGWEVLDEWDAYSLDELEHGEWQLDGEIDTYTDKEGE
jgi:hypothetical protein